MVVNGSENNPVYSEWRVIDDINDHDAITAKQVPEEEIGVIDLDFNKLAEADYPLVEVLLRFWPGDATKQLKKLNVAMNSKRFGNVHLKEFFNFFACLLAAAPAGFGGGKLWKPSKVKSIFAHPDLSGIMKVKRFEQIKACFADAFAYDWSHIPKEGEEWSPIEGKTPSNDEWAPLQGLVNDFNEVVARNYSESNQKCFDESMSPWRPRTSKKGNLPHLSYIMRKPKPLGTEFKSVGCAATGVMLHLEIQRGKVSITSLASSKGWCFDEAVR